MTQNKYYSQKIEIKNPEIIRKETVNNPPVVSQVQIEVTSWNEQVTKTVIESLKKIRFTALNPKPRYKKQNEQSNTLFDNKEIDVFINLIIVFNQPKSGPISLKFEFLDILSLLDSRGYDKQIIYKLGIQTFPALTHTILQTRDQYFKSIVDLDDILGVNVTVDVISGANVRANLNVGNDNDSSDIPVPGPGVTLSAGEPYNNVGVLTLAPIQNPQNPQNRQTSQCRLSGDIATNITVY